MLDWLKNFSTLRDGRERDTFECASRSKTAPPGNERKGMDDVKILLSGLLLVISLGVDLAVAEDGELFYKGVQAFRARDYDGAISWFEKAAEEGDGEAQFLLGRMYYDGNSLTVDYVTAYKWFVIASTSQVAVAPRYRDGLAHLMKEEEIAEGQRQAEDWLARFPRKP
jgi:uncharacterized protein